MAATSTSAATSAISPQTLTESDFLNLLVTQMTSQDPLNPQSDTAFAAQLAQFTALQTAQTTQGNIASLQASNLIGATVTVMPSGAANPLTGVVSEVTVNAGTPYVVIDGNAYQLSQILAISPTAAAPTSNPQLP